LLILVEVVVDPAVFDAKQAGGAILFFKTCQQSRTNRAAD
jgi:hypothetical protein